MNGDHSFWLYLSRTSDAFDESGATPSARAAMALQQFEEMPPIAQREVLGALANMAYQLPNLFAIVSARANEANLASKAEAAATR
jgi:hypothetical protein